MLVDAVDFLNADDQNEVRLPVVKFLATQRASSLNTDLGDSPHGGSPSFDQSDLPSKMSTGGLRPRTKCGAVKLTSDRAMDCFAE
jgi:hypothetical protein